MQQTMTAKEFLAKYPPALPHSVRRGFPRPPNSSYRNVRPKALCADGFSISIQASINHYCTIKDDGEIVSVELGYPSKPIHPKGHPRNQSVYGHVAIATVERIVARHGGIIGRDPVQQAKWIEAGLEKSDEAE